MNPNRTRMTMRTIRLKMSCKRQPNNRLEQWFIEVDDPELWDGLTMLEIENNEQPNP